MSVLCLHTVSGRCILLGCWLASDLNIHASLVTDGNVNARDKLREKPQRWEERKKGEKEREKKENIEEYEIVKRCNLRVTQLSFEFSILRRLCCLIMKMRDVYVCKCILY